MSDEERPVEVKLDAEFGMPLIEGTQRPMFCARMYDEDDGRIVTETLVFPNFVWFALVADDGLRIADSRFCSPQFARLMGPHLEELSAHVTDCENPGHAGRYMRMIDLDTADFTVTHDE